MVSDSDHHVVNMPKKCERLKRSGFSNGELYEITVINERNNVKAIRSPNNYPSSSDSEVDSEDCDNDEEKTYDYISLFQFWMNYLFPRAFRTQPVHRRIKSAEWVSDLSERSTGKILSPVGKSELFPQGVFVQSTTENDVTKISFPKAEETFKVQRRRRRSRKQTV